MGVEGRRKEKGRRREGKGRKGIRVHIQVFYVNWISEKKSKEDRRYEY